MRFSSYGLGNLSVLKILIPVLLRMQNFRLIRVGVG